MEPYQGFEQGPIRPPSEADSMLLRVTRNCSWNRCTFCQIYKRKRFSLRPLEEVLRDIDTVADYVNEVRREPAAAPRGGTLSPADGQAYAAARNWVANGCRSIFLQDGNSLIMPPPQLIQVLRHIKQRFPMVERITSYARSDTVARISDAHLREMAEAGLNRIHVGLETASDTILSLIHKGVTQAVHIKAGVKVKQAGMELSEYVLTGIGGEAYSTEHALETAAALNQINPDFIRFRTLHLPDSVPLFGPDPAVPYACPGDLVIAREIQLLLSSLSGITSTVKSDHMLNLFQEVDGVLPRDQARLVQVLQTFIDLDPQQRLYFQLGKRLGYFLRLGDLQDPAPLAQVAALCRRHGFAPETADQQIQQMLQERMRRGLSM